MKARWVLLAACIAGLCVFAGCGIHAQGRGRGHDRDRFDHFSDRDRDVLRQWYFAHSQWIDRYRNEGWHDDDLDRRIQVGAPIGPDMRRWSHPLPDDVASQMGPFPEYWHVVVMGDHAVLIDDNWNVRDFFHFEQFGDHDRQVVHEWNRDHPDYARGLFANFGVRIDDGDLDRRLQVGLVVDRDLQRRAQNAPPDLVSRMNPTPRDTRYLVIGDRLCLIDRQWRVRQSFHFEH